MGLEIITPPPSLPISLDEFRAHVIEAVSATDSLLTQTITEATEWVQNETQRQLIPATYIQTWDRFPHEGNRHGVHDYGGQNYWFQRGYVRRRRPLHFDVRPVISLAWVKYYDVGGTLQTLDPGQYWFDPYSRPPRIAPKDFWPESEHHHPGAVQVMFTAGYPDGDAATIHGTGVPNGAVGSNGDYYIDDATGNYYGPKTAGAWGSVLASAPTIAKIPNMAKLAIKQLAAFWFEQREAVVISESAEPTATYPAIGDIPFGVQSLCDKLNASGYT